MSFLALLLSKVPAKAWLYIVLSGLAFAGWNHYTGLVRDNSVLQANIARMEVASQQQEAAIGQMKAGLEEWKTAQTKLIERAAKQRAASTRASAEKRRINEIFSKHDLGKLAMVKPGLVERLLNRGSVRVGRMLSCTTGDQDKCPADNDRSS